MLLLLLLVAGVTNTLAQSVTVEPTTGNLIAALTSGSEVGFINGSSAMWRHEQLPLTFTVADDGTLTEGGEISNPAGDMRVHNGYLVVHGGVSNDLYCVLSLPKGYRFTGYKMVLMNNLYGETVAGQVRRGGNKVMYETDRTFNTSSYNARGCYNKDQSQYQMGTTSNTNEYVLERHSLTDTDMSNQLYFRLTHTNTRQFFAVSIKSFEVYFTAEGNFSTDIQPADVGSARSVVMSPFKTSKIDIGELKRETKTVDGVTSTYFAYNYNNVRDLDGYTYLYQSDAVTDGVAVEGTEAKHIYSVKVDGKNQYAFGEGTYYVESPTTIHTQSGLEAPVGYRIVGAKFTPLWGTETQGGTETRTHYYVTYTSGGTTYYLNDQLHFTTNKFAWSYDENTRGLYMGSGDNIRYLACTGSGDTRTVTTSSDPNGNWNLEVFTRNGNTYLGWSEWNIWLGGQRQGYVTGTTNSSQTVSMVRNNGAPSNAARVTSETETVTIPAYKPGTYTLNVYDKTGKNPHAIEISGATDSDLNEPYDMGKLNNDAVKFSISGLQEGKQALVAISVEMQALNPYINSMEIVCKDPTEQLRLSQTFTAENFMVSGGSFKFYIPSDERYATADMSFSFENLWSKDGDETYEGEGKGFGRYSFVSSPYFETVDGNGDNGLYDNAYDPETPSTTKIYATNVGNIRFKFNNAEDLGNNSTGTGHLEENPFSVSAYLGSEDPDGSEETGEFSQIVLNASKPNQKSDIAYLFTADETRYNIAPTTAWQHRSYAFYRMDVELEARSYTPELTWTKVYDENKTCYADQDENGNDVDASKSMWGLKLGTLDENGDKVEGYLSIGEIAQSIKDAFTSAGTNHPTSQDQILYVDASKLKTIVSSLDEDGNPVTVESINALLAPNSLFFLPKNMTSTADNIAYKTTSGSFNAGRNIVLTDRKPFYSPYDIQVGAAPNYAMYTRNVTWAKNGKVTNATLLVPFQIGVDDNGLHDDGEGNKFTVHQIAGDKALSPTATKEIDNIHVLPVEGVKTTVPNVPYVVSVSAEDQPTDANTSFVVKQTGALVKATSSMDEDTYEFTGTRGNGISGKTDVTFTPTGSYSGKMIPKSGNETLYYFGKNMFLKLGTLTSANLYMYPFRAYFRTVGESAAKQLNIFLGENTNTTGINEVETETMFVDPNAPVYDVYGRKIANSVREIAGKKLPRGIYVVNGAKFNVK
jgi:hypothetical protein